MRKSLIIELKKLAQEILLLKDDSEIGTLRSKSQELNEKMVVLEFLNNDPETMPDELNYKKESDSEDQTSKEVKIKPSFENQPTNIISEKSINEVEKEPSNEKIEISQSEQKDEPISLEDLFVPTFESIKEDMGQKEEFKDIISLDETEKLFGTKKEEPKQLSLNDKLHSSSIQIGLNDRIAFVNKLFNFSQSDFNKVLSKLNSCKNKEEALNYIQFTVKPNYKWMGKEELEERFILLVERKFL